MTYEELIHKYPLLAISANGAVHHETLVMLAYHAGRWDGIDTALKIGKAAKDSDKWEYWEGVHENVKA